MTSGGPPIIRVPSPAQSASEKASRQLEEEVVNFKPTEMEPLRYLNNLLHALQWFVDGACKSWLNLFIEMQCLA